MRPLTRTLTATTALAAIAGTIVMMVPACSPDRPARDTNVVLIVIDTLRADRLSCQGWDRLTSPAIDALASSGARMAENYSQCSWTQPSVVSMMTGQYITRYRDTYSEGAPVLARTLNAAGYHTIGVVSNTLVSPEAGFDAGFDHYDARRLTQAERDARKAAGGSPGPCRDAPEMLDELIDEVDKHLEGGDDAPMFLYWHLMEPHAPYLAHADLAQEFTRRDDLPSPWHQQVYDAAAKVPDAEQAASWNLINSGRTRYEREIRKADDAVAQLLAALEERGMRENTIFVIASDHGESLWDHPTMKLPIELAEDPPHKYFHQEHAMLLNQGLVRTPLIVAGPGVPAGTVLDANTENVDIFPTLLELLDLAGPRGLHGESLVPAWHGKPLENGNAHAYVLHNLMIREADTNLKFILPTKAGETVGGRPHLYNVHEDEAEQIDLSVARRDDRNRLLDKLRRWREAYPTVSLIRVRGADEQNDFEAMGYAGDDEEDEE
jgi:arylsulfatase A-like enzyme